MWLFGELVKKEGQINFVCVPEEIVFIHYELLEAGGRILHHADNLLYLLEIMGHF